MKINNHLKNVLISMPILMVAIVLGIIFQYLNVTEHITTIFVFAVFLISLFTDGFLSGIIASVIGTFAINYIFTYPYFAFDFITPVNMTSAVIMVTSSVLTSMLTTQIKRHEATKAESERERMRANLLRAVSHDLRTPLTTIYSACSTLRSKRDVLTIKQQDRMLQNIQEDSEWLIGMVENLLSITRIDNGQVNLIKTPTIVDELIDSAITKFRKRHPEQAVHVELTDDILFVSIDALLIEQVILNLLENAVYHAKGMTSLTLRVFDEGTKAVFEISDDGCGIPDEKLKHIFSGEYGQKQDVSGEHKRFAGIGLAVCATIIKAHDGEISAHNKTEGGAVFRFTLNKEDSIDG